jgi:ribosomal protein S18 acetylase RimI-like enzyme
LLFFDGIGGLFSISPATVAELPAALDLIYCHLDGESRAREVTASLADVHRAAAGFVVLAARQDGILAGAALLEFSPGKAALLRGPAVAIGQGAQIGKALVHAAVSAAANRGMESIRSSLADRGTSAEILVDSGFDHLTDALLLASDEDALPAEEPASRLIFEPFNDSPVHCKRLADLILQTYRGSQDCLGLQEARSMADVLADYRATGNFDPGRWVFARQNGRDVGCVLLAEHYALPGDKEPPNWELIYLGIIPECRGNGYGIELVRFAQWLCKTSGGKRLTLAVDANNRPALRIYGIGGFHECDRRRVFVKSLEK